ncbi:hypothetical protein GWI33_020146 [Rhynchophorus ferrugineus]|uniref:Uncharacterized protein n=1 Tax=Rhynchophorus ferrugineus TaxID=354439 RepID=A0A834M0R1_RHYFE|nr:hypothetical protein GWI33_020146 [Rhynchophorus ferrugineus]
MDLVGRSQNTGRITIKISENVFFTWCHPDRFITYLSPIVMFDEFPRASFKFPPAKFEAAVYLPFNEVRKQGAPFAHPATTPSSSSASLGTAIKN